jgi:hypothetical protein
MIKQLSWRLLMLAGMIAAGACSAAAQTFTCISTLTPGSYNTVNVPAGQNCTLSSGTVTVAANVTVGPGATLTVTGSGALTVSGSLLFVHSAGFNFTSSGPVNVLGSMSFDGVGSEAKVDGEVFIGGTFSFINSGSLTWVGINVGGNMLIQNNSGPITLEANTIGGSLVCTGNGTLPTNGGFPNTVGGNTVGQCKGL